MTFESTINIGTLVTFGLALLGFIGAWHAFAGRLDLLEYRVTSIDKTLELIAGAVEKLGSNEKLIALTEAHVTAIEAQIVILSKEIYDLRRGDGWIQNNRRANVDGEYKRKD